MLTCGIYLCVWRTGAFNASGFFVLFFVCFLLFGSSNSREVLTRRGREAGSRLFAVRPGFNVVVTSTCDAKSYRRALHKLLPLHRMRVIQVLAHIIMLDGFLRQYEQQ